MVITGGTDISQFSTWLSFMVEHDVDTVEHDDDGVQNHLLIESCSTVPIMVILPLSHRSVTQFNMVHNLSQFHPAQISVG